SMAPSAAISMRRCSATASEAVVSFPGIFRVFRLIRFAGGDLSGQPLDDRGRYHGSPGELPHGGLEAAGETPGGLRAVDRRAVARRRSPAARSRESCAGPG